MNLIVSCLTIVDLTNKEAAKISFKPGKNFITSTSNHLGKSVIMKSIYYALGAETIFSNTIKKINFLAYIDFFLENSKYRICRLKNNFTIYKDDILLSKHSSVGDFQNAITEIFNFEIDLVGKDAEKSIKKCPPAFFYLPYYIDQENGWSSKTDSFDRLAEFDLPQRKNSYFFHLGVFDNRYVEISKKKKFNDKRKNDLEKEIERLKTVIETLNDGTNDITMNFDIQALEKSIEQRKGEIKTLLSDVSLNRKKLIEAEDQLSQILHDKEILSKYINKKAKKDDDTDVEIVECPNCGSFFDHTLVKSMQKKYILESLNSDYATLLSEEKKTNKQIEKLKKKFVASQDLLNAFEKNLTSSKEEYDLYIRSKATAQLLSDYHKKIGADVAEIDELSNENTNINSEIAIYTENKSEANNKYVSRFSKVAIKLDIPSDQIGSNIEPGSFINASGAYGPRCKIAQLLSFVETQKEIASDIITFPIVIDSPNVLEQDKEHFDAIMRTLFNWNATENQIIIASIEGIEIANQCSDVNIIKLTNEKNHIMSANAYELCKQEIETIFIDF